MRSTNVLALAGYISSASAALKGFNYGATDTSGAVKLQADYEAEFKAAKALVGVNDFTSARLYTTIQSGGGPIQAIPAAIAQDTSLLLGIWCSGGEAAVQAEIDALKQAIEQYGTDFTSRVVGLSVGSEDLYRDSSTGQLAKAGIGAGPDVISNYIAQVRAAVAGTSLSSVSIGHVDTWTAWVNGSNTAVIEACDWIGFDAYPYFQDTQANGIENGKALFLEAYEATKAATGKDVWITETGWPVSGKTAGSGVPSLENAKTYWDEVGCGFAFDNINTWWYTLLDAAPTTPNPSFGIIGYPITGEPLFDLSCSNITSSTTSSASATGTAASSVVSSASSAATGIVSSGGALSPSQGSGSGGAAVSSATLSTVSAGSTGTSGGSSGSGSGSGSSNGTFTATSISPSSASGTASSTAPITANAGSAISGSAVGGFAGALLAMMMAL